MPSDKQLRAMILDVISEADYDLGKSFDPKLSEDPEETGSTMQAMIEIAKTHLAKWSKS